MDRRSCAKLRVLIVGQQNSFAHILATNIQCWGHEVRVLPSEMVMCGDPVWETGSGASEVEGDVLLYDLDESVCISRLTGGRDTPTLHMSLPSGFAGEDGKGCGERLPAVPLARQQHACLTIALSSFSVSRTTLERIGAVALLQKPFEMSRLQHYLRVLRSLLLEGEEIQQLGNNVAGHVPRARGDEEGPGDAAGRADSPKLRILVVDDDVTLANVIRKTLIFESRYEVVVAYNGLEALEQCLRWKPHCIVTDLIMPWMNGYQVMRCLAASSLQTMPAFVIMSALAQLEVPLNGSYLRGKMVAYVNKPFSIDHLFTAIEQVCNIDRQGGFYVGNGYPLESV